MSNTYTWHGFFYSESKAVPGSYAERGDHQENQKILHDLAETADRTGEPEE